MNNGATNNNTLQMLTEYYIDPNTNAISASATVPDHSWAANVVAYEQVSPVNVVPNPYGSGTACRSPARRGQHDLRGAQPRGIDVTLNGVTYGPYTTTSNVIVIYGGSGYNQVFLLGFLTTYKVYDDHVNTTLFVWKLGVQPGGYTIVTGGALPVCAALALAVRTATATGTVLAPVVVSPPPQLAPDGKIPGSTVSKW